MILWTKTKDILPDDCEPVIGKYGSEDEPLIGIFTIIGDIWVTDSTEAELYGAKSLNPIKKKNIPFEWMYIFR